MCVQFVKTLEILAANDYSVLFEASVERQELISSLFLGEGQSDMICITHKPITLL